MGASAARRVSAQPSGHRLSHCARRLLNRLRMINACLHLLSRCACTKCLCEVVGQRNQRQMDIGDEAALKEGIEEVARPPLTPIPALRSTGQTIPGAPLARVWESDWKGLVKKGVIYQMPLFTARPFRRPRPQALSHRATPLGRAT